MTTIYRHAMETLFIWLAAMGNRAVTGRFPHKVPVAVFDAGVLNKMFNRKSIRREFEAPWGLFDVVVMLPGSDV